MNDPFDRVRREFTRAHGVINAFAGKWLHHARRVADQKQIVMCRRKSGPGKRSDRVPRMIAANTELLFSPPPERRYMGGLTYKAQIQFIAIHRCLTGITFAQELQNNAIVKT